MNIVYKNKENKVAFKAIAIGDVFSYDGTLFMSTVEILSAAGKLYNAVNLDTGGLICFDDHDEVTEEEVQVIVS